MADSPYKIFLGDVEIKKRPDDQSAPIGLCVDWESGVDGWRDLPDSKVGMTEKQLGDGSFPVFDSAVTYASRTVTINVIAFGKTRDAVIGYQNELVRQSHRVITLRVIDDYEDTFSDGYIKSIEWESVRVVSPYAYSTGKVNFICPDPRRFAYELRTAYMSPYARATDGLQYSDDGGILIPLNYGSDSGSIRNIATIANEGTCTAYPTITASGNMTGFTIVDVESGRQLSYSQPITSPVVFDSMSETANVNGVDVSRNLVDRQFPSIQAGGSITLAMYANGSGSVEITSRDTYI